MFDPDTGRRVKSLRKTLLKKWWLLPNMTENLLNGTLIVNINICGPLRRNISIGIPLARSRSVSECRIAS